MKTIELIQKKIEALSLNIKHVTVEKNQFLKNLRYDYTMRILMLNRENLLKHKNLIGKEVFKTINSFNYSDVPNTSFMNTTTEEPIILTEELFMEFCEHFLAFLINRFTEELLEHSITSNSTDKLSNLEFEIILEEKQWLIKFYKELLGGLRK
jgi:hypothetical protein